MNLPAVDKRPGRDWRS